MWNKLRRMVPCLGARTSKQQEVTSIRTAQLIDSWDYNIAFVEHKNQNEASPAIRI
jgi:hypothetical protein